MRIMRNPAGSEGMFSIFALLDGFMTKSFAEKIDLCITSRRSLRLDKTLTQIMPEELKFSRSRVQALITSGSVSDINGKLLTDPSSKAHFGLQIRIVLPRTAELELVPENIELDIIYEDSELLIVNKPAGMVVHPASGVRNGTLVNALLFHCGNSLSGIGGIRRPGIVHRIDKDTSGLLVVAKTDLAYSGLASQFRRHNVERKYVAFVYGRLSQFDKRLKNLNGLVFESDGRIRISSKIGRHKFHRKKMAVHENFGRHAVTRIFVTKSFGTENTEIASLIECQLETGRTHQIRVHLHHLGHSIIGDQTYGQAKKSNFRQFKEVSKSVDNLKRQALHAKTLGFVHPKTKEWLTFSSKIPADMDALYHSLEQLNENQ